ncbi:MAG: VTT domain-containing protein [Pseudomonadota bacterium]
MDGDEETSTTGTKRSGPARFLPIAVIGAGALAALFFAGDYLSFQTLADNREVLVGWRDQNWAMAALTYMAFYVLAVAFSVPGAVWLTIGGGFLFGLVPNTLMTVVAATIGAVLIFLAARTSLGSLLREKAGPWLTKLESGFREGEVSYLLMMRLVPAVPFFIANLAPAFLGVKLGNFTWTTLVGIIPGTAVFASIGAGLGELLDQGETPDLSIIFSPAVLGPLLALAALAALPLLIKKIRGRAA